MGRLIAVSNRTAADPGARAGGLAVALWDALLDTGGLWFGWSGEVVDADARGVRMLTDGGVEFALADLTRTEHDGYYLGYANRTLWPVMHYRTDLAVFNQDDFAIYDAVNRRFAQTLMHQLREDDVVWAHDYHFMVFAEALRQQGWSGRLGYFLHIPFPPPEIFRALPEHARLARALLAYDVIGFQTTRDRDNFVRYFTEDRGDSVYQDGVLRIDGRRVAVDAFPIGIDAEEFTEMATCPAAREAAERIRRFLGERRLVLGVDRMDYSKGLPERFAAMGRLFDVYQELRGDVSFTQIAPPSRSMVDAYIELRGELDGLAGRINGEYGDLDWIPIRYLARSYSREVLAGLFRLAHVGLVTPLRDGMNLVAKEYVAAQDPEDPGVLVLSEFAGAAEQLRDAVLVNPHNVSDVTEMVRRALEMPLAERRRRWEACYQVVCEENVGTWRTAFLARLNAVEPDVAAPRD